MRSLTGQPGVGWVTAPRPPAATAHSGHRRTGDQHCRRCAPADRGVATVYACLGVVIMLAVLGLALHLGAATLARQRAETGADLAALAGAAKILQGPDAVCARVVAVATANEVTVASCTVSGADVLVIVQSRLRTGPVVGSATGRARAGPVRVISEIAG